MEMERITGEKQPPCWCTQIRFDPAALAALRGADRGHLVRATVADPADHVHLQAAWAAVRWLVRRGAACALDGFALRWHGAAALAAHDVAAPLDLAREVTVVVEAAPRPGAPARVVHTRGLRKVARPDVIELLADDGEPDAAVARVRAVAARLVDGWLPAPDDAAAEVAPAPAALTEALGLNNDALLLLPPAAPDAN